jgi:hypothetical protein
MPTLKLYEAQTSTPNRNAGPGLATFDRPNHSMIFEKT